MNRFCTDIGFKSANKHGEQLCGDHIETAGDADNSIVVLADGMGSGVKANILATLTAKIISTMIAEGMSIEECVRTIADTLPVCSERGAAYSTFTIIRIRGGERAEIIQYDNPDTIVLREGKNLEYEKREITVGGKRIWRAEFRVQEGDILVAMSDGVIGASVGMTPDRAWQRPDIIDFLETFATIGFTAKTLTTMLVDECVRRYANEPGDDTTVCAVRIRKREQVNLVIGPPAERGDARRMMALFFAKDGKHIVCGGTTSSIAADYLGKSIVARRESTDPEIPPISSIEGCDLVTEGVVTINKVLSYALDALGGNEAYSKWAYGQDGASLIARMLFEEATDIDFFVGRAANPAHQSGSDPINFNVKMRLVDELADCLNKLGKRIKVSYF